MMNQNGKQMGGIVSDGISVSEVFANTKIIIEYLKSKWITILVISFIGAIVGIGYSIIKKPTYTAVCTFVLEDSKSSGLGQYANLAAIAGINLGGTGGGIFEGDNILELYKSRTMIEKALLSSDNFNGKNELLIDRYISSYNLREKWKNEKGLEQINFNGSPNNFNRKQDSIITDLSDEFNKECLDVSKPDKKLSIIKVQVITRDELFSKFFTEKLVQNVNDFYVQTKTKKVYQNVQILQHQADSVKALLNYSIFGVASAIDAAPNANPQMSSLRVTSQKKQVDVQANTAIYGEIVKNLELAKISFRQETPLIQIIDKPVLPLTVKKLSHTKGTILGFIVFGFVSIIFLSIKRSIINGI